MGEVVRRLVWFVVVAMIVVYASFMLLTDYLGWGFVRERPLMITDTFGKGVHHLSGEMLVPSDCHQLSVHTETVSPTTFLLVFQSWEEPSVLCERVATLRHFTAVAFTSAIGVNFLATLDGRPLPIHVLPPAESKKRP